MTKNRTLLGPSGLVSGKAAPAVPVLGLLAAAALLAACRPEPAPEPDRRPVVAAAAVADSALVRPIVAAGSLGASNESDLAFTVPGKLSAVQVTAGTRVARGAVLAALDPQAVAAQVSAAEAGLEKAERDLARARRLQADSVIAAAVVQDAETAVSAARATADAARFAARTAVITAPADGIVLVVHRDPGSVVGAGEPVLRFAGTGAGSVFRAGLTDRDALAVAVGDEAEVRLDALPDQVFRGRVRERAAAPSAGTGTYATEIAVTGAADLPRGLSGTVSIVPRGRISARLVPLAAVIEADGNRGAVFVLDGDRAVRTEVTLGPILGDRVVVTGGLDTARRVVTAGGAYLVDGTDVTVVAR
ncbi:MAG: efflux RND transporter periplasmic adaptor subunit [Gemmatimonadales bacterium]